MSNSPERREAFDAFVGKYQAAVYRYLRLLGAARDEAEDLLQETFLVVLGRESKQGEFEDRDEISTRVFLRRTARNLFLHRMRSERKRHAAWADLVDDHLAAEENPENPWLEALDACLGNLQGRARDALRLVYTDERSRSDAAAALGLKENGLKTLLQRSKRVLRTCVGRRLE